MSSDRKTSAWAIAANRRNAAHSTGPRSPQGKVVVSANALKHGLSSRNPTALPPAIAEALPARLEMWKQSVGGVSRGDVWLLRKLALASLQADVAEQAIGECDARASVGAEDTLDVAAIDLGPDAERLRGYHDRAMHSVLRLLGEFRAARADLRREVGAAAQYPLLKALFNERMESADIPEIQPLSIPRSRPHPLWACPSSKLDAPVEEVDPNEAGPASSVEPGADLSDRPPPAFLPEEFRPGVPDAPGTSTPAPAQEKTQTPDPPARPSLALGTRLTPPLARSSPHRPGAPKRLLRASRPSTSAPSAPAPRPAPSRSPAAPPAASPPGPLPAPALPSPRS